MTPEREQALQHQRAAELLLIHAWVTGPVLGVHLVAALRALQPALESAALADWAASHLVTTLPEAEQERARTAIAALFDSKLEPERAGVVAALRGLDRHLHAGSVPTPTQRWWLRAGIVLATLVVVAFAAEALVFRVDGDGPWRGSYYLTDDFSGRALERFDDDVHFDWGRGKPHPDLPIDEFSIRWETCLRIDHRGPVAFQLTSDDGSRLWLNDRKMVENGGKHPVRTKGTIRRVVPGNHYLRLDYFEAQGPAEVKLRASFDDETPQRIDPSRLSPPGPDPDDPCPG